MSKYQPLWDYVMQSKAFPFQLTFEEVQQILGFTIDHSFLNAKKELVDRGYSVEKISLNSRFLHIIQEIYFEIFDIMV